ncbi:ABC transporter ATP-binding protein [Glaciibacter psychrotolerans]|uniref:Branched-chain amino acid transport system ATP-binding protein n=1 Tax=Glaciibacter psychrotolerans TaxID=670054 RepID=A0A7Z0EFB1_9MICO|nr:ABC transporter ATP-binding protein [Leifsonia psychrotolerans]NYJ20475.1 branched-chain amino acid transport system ATP-binding protein [Leifsonia psychrotolerans]
MSNEVLLEVSGMQTGYGDLKVVRDASLVVRRGEITVLLGRNGAGKTTTLRGITGLNKVTGGVLNYLGEDITGVPAPKRVARGISYVQEGKRIFHELTIEQNLLLGGYSTGVRKRALSKFVQEIYELFPILGEKRHLIAGSMSGGQQQMLAIGQALMAKPQLLILDEPSQGLAPVIVKEVMERVHALKDTGIGILLIEQMVQDSVAIADEVTVLEMGQTVLSRPAAEVTIEDLQQAYFGSV